MIKFPKITAKNLFLLLLLVCVSWFLGLLGRFISSGTAAPAVNAQCWTPPGGTEGCGGEGAAEGCGADSY